MCGTVWCNILCHIRYQSNTNKTSTCKCIRILVVHCMHVSYVYMLYSRPPDFPLKEKNCRVSANIDGEGCGGVGQKTTGTTESNRGRYEKKRAVNTGSTARLVRLKKSTTTPDGVAGALSKSSGKARQGKAFRLQSRRTAVNDGRKKSSEIHQREKIYKINIPLTIKKKTPVC